MYSDYALMADKDGSQYLYRLEVDFHDVLHLEQSCRLSIGTLGLDRTHAGPFYNPRILTIDQFFQRKCQTSQLNPAMYICKATDLSYALEHLAEQAAKLPCCPMQVFSHPSPCVL